MSHNAARRAAELGYTRVKVFAAGYPASTHPLQDALTAWRPATSLRSVVDREEEPGDEGVEFIQGLFPGSDARRRRVTKVVVAEIDIVDEETHLPTLEPGQPAGGQA